MGGAMEASQRARADRARSRLQTMTNTALRNLARRHGVDLMQGGREVSKKRKVARLMDCPAVVDELGGDAMA